MKLILPNDLDKLKDIKAGDVIELTGTIYTSRDAAHLRIKKMIVSKKLKIKISVDGGVNAEVAKKLDFVDIVVTGVYVTNSDNFEKAITTIREIASENEIKAKEQLAEKRRKKQAKE